MRDRETERRAGARTEGGRSPDRPSVPRARAAAPALLLVLPALLVPGCAVSRTHPEIVERLSGVDQARLRQHVETLAGLGPRTPSRLAETRAAADYIRGQLASYGYEVEEEPVEVAEGRFVNLLAEVEGAGERPPVVEVGAHYDSVPGSPGADDNASGVAGLLEIARVLAGSRPTRTIRFVFFALEEYGKHGSRIHVARLKERDEPLEGMIVLEMIGYATSEPGSQKTPIRIPLLLSPSDQGDFIAVVGNFSSGGIGNRFESAVGRYVPELSYFSANRLGGLFRDSRRSDHEAYWDAGYRAIMLTDTANFRNPHYHQPSDLPETLDFGFLAKVTAAAAAAVLEWAEPTGGRRVASQPKPLR